jgi:hypothetical protein
MVVRDMRVDGLMSASIHAVFSAFKSGVILVASLARWSTLSAGKVCSLVHGGAAGRF